MQEIYQLAIESSIKAGEAIMEIYNSDNFEITEKADDSPLTKADFESNKVIVNHLKKTGIPIISEEEKQTDFEVRKKWSTCWIIDPLDGTKEFIKRNGEFTVNIALVENNSPIFGIIYVPVTRELFVGDVSGEKSLKVVVDNSFRVVDFESSALEIKPSEKTTTLARIVGSRSHMNELTENFVNQQKLNFEKIEIVSKGSSLKFCLVAEGKADIYPRFAPTMEWDTAAGHAICKAVGVDVINQSTQEEMRYNKENLLNPHFLVRKNG